MREISLSFGPDKKKNKKADSRKKREKVPPPFSVYPQEKSLAAAKKGSRSVAEKVLPPKGKRDKREGRDIKDERLEIVN